ncbi:MAG: MotA/TolQ/ExbB proton channel family protein [Verrucomicrobia bacterium]|nr:MotA/TolQ/ExbB proton channel family protein [Verrucomicrobiota bacterium]
MIQLFLKGGPIMWPLLLTSLVAATVVIERLLFIVREKRRRTPDVVENILGNVEKGLLEEAFRCGSGSEDFVARTLVFALKHRAESLSSAILRAANLELQRFNRGLPILDTIITLAPLLGLLGTVTGMIRSFGLLGGEELGATAAITGGIAEALIATAFGLGIAIIALLPFNYLNARMEAARREMEDAATHLELLLTKAACQMATANCMKNQAGKSGALENENSFA